MRPKAALRDGAIDRRTWDHVRAVLLNPERLTLGNTPTKYLLMGVIFCGVCGGRMFSRPRDDHTKRYVCAGRRPGHQLTIVAQPVDDLVARRVLELLTTPAFRRFSLNRGRPTTDRSAEALAALGSAQSRMQTLDDDSTCEAPSASAGTARSGRGWSGRSSVSTPRLITRASSGSSCIPTPGASGPKQTSASAVSWCASSSSGFE